MTATTDNTSVPGRFEELSPRKIILHVRHTGTYVLSRWWIILLVALLFGLGAGIYSFFKKPLYMAEATFVIDEEVTGNDKSSISLISEQLGLGAPFEAGTVFSSTTNIVELMQSRLLIERTLRSSVTVNGKNILFADFFLDSLDFRDEWMKETPYYHLNFLAPKKDEREMRFENGVMQNMYDLLTTKYITVDRKGKGTTIISVKCISTNELFSKYFLESWLKNVTEYYVETKTQRARLNVDFIQKRTDSIRNAYNGALYGRASYTDAHVNPARQTASVATEKQQTDVQLLKTSYVELVRSLESAKTTLMRDTPLIQYIDTPVLPLKITIPNLLKRFLIFFFVGGFLAVVYLVLRRTYRQIMDQPVAAETGA